MGRGRYKIINPEMPHFLILTVLHWISVFTRPETVNILLKSLSRSFPRSCVGTIERKPRRGDIIVAITDSKKENPEGVA